MYCLQNLLYMSNNSRTCEIKNKIVFVVKRIVTSNSVILNFLDYNILYAHNNLLKSLMKFLEKKLEIKCWGKI